ncbi:hypothetical protein JKF63_02286 [Porcisia hertigi]|uniref:Kinesin motor domain-containing protein n=1 Tax=Porcisia hertigi TaxID=2761500 RepID=A0A836L1J6_9TRYP|nr:hypothetical protein JKF63_02286 [Porcisia hertigi]
MSEGLGAALQEAQSTRAESVAHSSEASTHQNTSYEEGRITVGVRVRPLNSREIKLNTGSCITALASYNTLYIFPSARSEQEVNALLSVEPSLRGTRHHRFTFDHVYPVDSTQEQVYEQIGRPVLQSSFSGYHTCIFTYGQTGSGKSYCMMGPNGGCSMDDAPGIVPRLCREMFVEMHKRKHAAAANDEKVDFSVYVSYVEIYRERVRSLLDEVHDTSSLASGSRSPRSTSPGSMSAALPRSTWSHTAESAETTLRVREHPTLGVYVEGLAEIPATSEQQVLRLMARGNQRRHTASTRMNDTSSRSHAIFTLQLLQKRIRAVPSSEGGTGALATGEASATEAEMITQLGAKINLVDLAGSERAKSTGAEGDTLKEGAQINKSLTTLGIVINALAAQCTATTSSSKIPTPRRSSAVSKRHIPYRDSTLTFLLKESLGGNSKTFMIATISPSLDSYDESLSTLRYADRAKAIVMKAFVNETAGDKRIRELEEEVMRLREQIRSLLGGRARHSSTVMTSLAAESDVLADSQSPLSPSPERGSDLKTGEAEVGDDYKHDGYGRNMVYSSISNIQAASVAEERMPLQGLHAESDAHAKKDAGSPAAVPPEEEEDYPPGVEFVDALQSELRRAEEMIRQMSALEANRSTHRAQLMREHKEEQATMRATAVSMAASTALRDSEDAATGPLSPTMRLRRDEPYLLNMDGAGDWVAAHLGPGETLVGVFPCHDRGITESAEASSAAKGSKGEVDGNQSTSFDSSLVLSSPHSGCEAPVNRDAEVRQVHLPIELSEGVGRPHCILERTNVTGIATTASWTTTLRACPGHETHVIRSMYQNPFVVRGGGTFALQSGDVLDIGVNHIQLKYIDPAEPPGTARGRQVRQVKKAAAIESDDQADDRAERDRCMNSGATFPASGVYGKEEVPGQPQGFTSTSDEHLNGERCDSSLASSYHDGLKSSEGNAAPSLDEDSVYSEFGDEIEDGSSVVEHEDQDGDGDMGEPPKRAGVGTTTTTTTTTTTPATSQSPSRPLIPTLNLGVALSGNRLSPQPQKAVHQVQSMGAVSFDSANVDTEELAFPPILSDVADHSAARSSAQPRVKKLSFSLPTSAGSQPAAGPFVQARLPSKRGPQTVHLNPSSVLSCSDVQSIRTSTPRNTGRSEVPPRFVGRYNLILMGPSGSGKSSIVQNLKTEDPPWFQTAFTLLTGRRRTNSLGGHDGDSPGSLAKHPTVGIETTTLTVAGAAPVFLHVHELGGAPLFCPLLEELPFRRVTYLLCFPLNGGPSFVALRGIVEDILCRTDSHTVSLVLVGTHAHHDRSDGGKDDSVGFFPRRLPAERLAQLEAQMEEMELQVVSLIQMVQPYPQLRPTVVGRFVVDNVHRQVYSSGYRAVEGFPGLLQWLGDLARDKCRADVDFVSGLVPARCLELGRQVGLLRQRGKWCLTLRDFKTLAAAVSQQYEADETTNSSIARETLRCHVQILSDWGVLMHHFRSAPLRQHVILDVLWIRRVLTALTCCALVAVAESGGFKRGEDAAAFLTGAEERWPASLGRKEAALRLLLTPEAARFLDVAKVATADTAQLLPYGVVSLPVLATILEPHLTPPASKAVTDIGGRSPREGNDATRRRDPTTASHRYTASTDVHYSVPLAGVVELLVLFDHIILGHKLLLSPCTDTMPKTVTPSTGVEGTPNRLCAPAASLQGEGSVHSDKSNPDINPQAESFVVYPLSCKTPASAGVTWLFPCFLSGPFYVFKLDMVPRNFFAKLICRLATVSDKIYLGPVGSQSCSVPSVQLSDDTSGRRGVGGKPHSAACHSTDACIAEGSGKSLVLPRFSPYLTHNSAEDSPHSHEGLWFDAAWLLYRDTVQGDGLGKENCRVLVRLVHHSVFLSFHCHQVASSFGMGAGGATAGVGASPGVQEFYEAVLEAVRLVVEEFPGGRCSELMQCCADPTALLEMETKHPAEQSNQEAAALDSHVLFVSINENLNSLERVLAKSGSALRTARTARRSHVTSAEDCNDENAYVPLLRNFSATSPLDITEGLQRWKTEQRFYIPAELEAQLVEVLQVLGACYLRSAPPAADSCAALDSLLDVLARIDTV